MVTRIRSGAQAHHATTAAEAEAADAAEAEVALALALAHTDTTTITATISPFLHPAHLLPTVIATVVTIMEVLQALPNGYII